MKNVKDISRQNSKWSC